MMFQPQLRHPHRFRLARGPLVALTSLTLGASALLWSPGSPVARAQETAGASADGRSYRLFYEKLGSDGDWLETDQYGYVFQPRTAVDDRNWRPYTDGYWAQTNAGWTWVSNEPFGWATYHYGRWANLVDVGWVWVPGSEWAPSYVSWRVSKDRKHVGWAPLPPEARLRKGAAIERWADTAYDIGPEAYVFIDTNRFGENSYRTHLLPAERNTTIITETENVTNVSYRTVENRSIIYGGGPDVAFIREGTGRPVREFQLETRAEPVTYFQGQDARGITSINGNRLIIATAAPDVITSSSLRVTQPATVRQHLNTITVDRGYRGVGDASVIDRVRATLRGQSPPPPPEIQREAHAAIQRNGAAVPPPAAAPGNAAAPRGAAMPPAPGASVNPSPAAAAATPAAGNAAPPPATPAARPSPAEAPHPGHTPPARREDAHPAATPVPEGHGAGTPKASSPASEKEAPPAAPAAAPKHRGEHAEKPPTPPAAAREEKPDAPAPKRPASEPPAAAPEQPKVKPQRPPSEEPRARGEGAAPERHREPAANPAGENEKKPKAEAAPHESRRPEAPPAAAPRRAEPEARPAPGGGAAPAPAREGKREKPEPAGAPAGQGAAKPSPQP